MLKKYAISAVNYVLNNLDNKLFDNINQVIIFGSVARGNADKESDVDVFFDAPKKYEKKIKDLINDFYTSRKGLLFKAENISNDIHSIIGKLEDWKDLHKSIASEGIVVYGPYMGKAPGDLKNSFIISWENLDIKNRGAFLNKVYGYSVGEKKYEGLINKWNAKKIGKSAILLPAQYKKKFMKILDKYKVDYRIISVYV